MHCSFLAPAPTSPLDVCRPERLVSLAHTSKSSRCGTTAGKDSMAKLRSALSAFVGMLLVHAAICSAQGVQTGTIRGSVRDQQNLSVPGVTVTVTSPSLQGPRTVVTDAAGNFTVAAVPAGQYQVAFELSGFASISQQTTVPLGLTVELDVVLRPAQVAEAV